jgi:carboxyl-terminal processing protease
MSKQDPSATPAGNRWGYFFLGMLTALIVFALGVGAMWAYAYWTGGRPQLAFSSRASDEAGAPVDDLLLNEAWEVIFSDFYGEIPSERSRTYGAIRGSLQTLEDPYTYFIEPEPAVREQERLQGRFGGIGAYLTVDDAGRILLDPMVDRPAARAGVRKGDILLAVDGREVPLPADLDQVTDWIRGEVGTPVKLTVQRGDDRLDFEVIRAEIELPSVTWQRVPDAPQVGYIRIERFSGVTAEELDQALEELGKAGADKALILDLRGNPGGLVSAAVDVASRFLDGGVVLIERHADGTEQVYEARPGVTAPPDASLVVLVDGNTASAAEIVAGALQDRDRATLVGQKTYGKGSIQRIHRLSDNSAVHVTFAKWFTPENRAIDGQGLEPDVATEPSPDEDAFLQKALELLRR